MNTMHASKVKLIYTDWYINSFYNERKAFGNAMHPRIREYIQYIYKNKLKIDYYNILQYEHNQQKAIKFDHADLKRFFDKNFPQNVISSNLIQDDDYLYIYPLEIKDSLPSLYRENSFILEDEKYSWYLKDMIPTDIIEHMRTGKVKILVSLIHDPLYDENSIMMFEQEMNELGIDGSNIIILGGSKFDEYYEKHPTSKVKIYNGHLFLKNYVDMIKEFPTTGDLGYICEIVEEKDLDENKLRPYKFLCNNKTMRKPHRASMGYFAIKYDLLKEGKFSFIENASFAELKNQIRQIIMNANDEYIQKLVSIIPYELDTQFLKPEQKGHFGAKNNMKEWYSDTYINLVTETFFGRNVFLSEKIFKPLSNLQPFIVLGDYGTLAELKRLGFKTFEPFIDESYDLEMERYKRIEKIEIEIEKLKNKSIEEIHNWYYSIKDILIHNQKHLYSFENYECFEEIFEKINLDYKN